MYNFGNRLHMLRRQKGVSMDEVAYVTGITKSNISKYERGVSDPALPSAYKLAEYFMVSLDWLVGYGDESEQIFKIPEKYNDVVKNAMSRNVSPEKLMKAIELIADKE